MLGLQGHAVVFVNGKDDNVFDVDTLLTKEQLQTCLVEVVLCYFLVVPLALLNHNNGQRLLPIGHVFVGYDGQLAVCFHDAVGNFFQRKVLGGAHGLQDVANGHVKTV